MSYVEGTDFISSTDEVRRLARNVPTADFSNDQVKSYQYKVYSIIRTRTDKDDWSPTDREYGALQLVETVIASEMLKMHYADSAEDRAAASDAVKAAFDELDVLIENLDTAITDSGTITATEYKSWNLNSSVPAPNRLTNVGNGIETKGSLEIDL